MICTWHTWASTISSATMSDCRLAFSLISHPLHPFTFSSTLWILLLYILTLCFWHTQRSRALKYLLIILFHCFHTQQLCKHEQPFVDMPGSWICKSVLHCFPFFWSYLLHETMLKLAHSQAKHTGTIKPCCYKVSVGLWFTFLRFFLSLEDMLPSSIHFLPVAFMLYDGTWLRGHVRGVETKCIHVLVLVRASYWLFSMDICFSLNHGYINWLDGLFKGCGQVLMQIQAMESFWVWVSAGFRWQYV